MALTPEQEHRGLQGFSRGKLKENKHGFRRTSKQT
jgi:hypothetical protein